MRAPLDLSGCLGDSPAFRKDVNVSEDSIAQLDGSIKNLMKIAKSSMDIATEYSSKNIAFAQELTDFAGFSESKEDPEIENALSKFGDTLKELERSRSMMISHMSDVFIDPIENFAKDEINPVKECKRRFDQASDCYDSTLSRYLNKKPKDVTIPEAAKEVEIARKDFLEKYLEHTIRLNELHSKKKCEFMEYVLAMMYTQFAFFHQGYELLRDLEPFMRDLTSELQTSRTLYQSQMSMIKSSKDRILKEAESTLNPLTSCPKRRDSGAIVKSGYLLKRGSGRMVQPWSKRHFSIEGELLVYSTRGKNEEPTVAINLRVCTVKPADSVDRRFCFEVISPQRTFLLQAESEEEASEWIRCLINATKAAIHKPALDSSKGFPHHALPRDLKSPSRLVDTGIKTEADPAQLFKVRTMSGNEACAECKGKDAVWASINLGIALCIECSGIHRSLGVHYSKVRSLTLDKWESEIIEVMLRLGNDRVNHIFEASLTPEERQAKRPSPISDRNEKLKWITAKYVKKEYVEKASDLPEGETVDTNFWRAINQSDLSSALRYLALGANVNYRNEQRNFTTPLHQAILASDNVSVEFLFQWGSDVNAVDADGWSSLHHAAATNNLRLVLHLLKRHAKLGIKDRLGKTPVDVATDQEHVQVVTTLRMFQFEQQEEIANAGRPGSFGYSDTLSSRQNEIPPGRNSINLPPSEKDLEFLESNDLGNRSDRPIPRRKSLDGALRDPNNIPANNAEAGGGYVGAAGFAAATATRFAANFKMPQFSRLHDMNAFPANPFATSPTSPSVPHAVHTGFGKSHTAPSSPVGHPEKTFNP